MDLIYYVWDKLSAFPMVYSASVFYVFTQPARVEFKMDNYTSKPHKSFLV